MTHSEAKEAATVMVAWASGAACEKRYRGTKEWIDTNPRSEAWDWVNYDHRVKSQGPREGWAVVDNNGKLSAVFERYSDALQYSATAPVKIREVRE